MYPTTTAIGMIRSAMGIGERGKSLLSSRVASLVGASAALLVSTASAASPQVAGRGVIDGTVTDTSLVSLADATVSILGSSLRVTTGVNGRFRVVGLAGGRYFVVVHHVGYRPASTAIEVAVGDTVRASFTLERITAVLDTVVVSTQAYTARMSEFEERRKFGFGHFFTQAQIEARDAHSVADVMQLVPSVNVVRGLFGSLAVSSRSGFNLQKGQCPLKVYLDDVLLSGAV